MNIIKAPVVFQVSEGSLFGMSMGNQPFTITYQGLKDALAKISLDNIEEDYSFEIEVDVILKPKVIEKKKVLAPVEIKKKSTRNPKIIAKKKVS